MPQKMVYSTNLMLSLGDITQSTADAIINDACSKLTPVLGPNKAIFAAAGAPLSTECQKVIEHQGPVQVTQNCVTDGGLLKVKYVIHAVGPNWQGGGADEERLLGSTYTNALKTAADYAMTSVAITPLAIGDHARFPVEKSAIVAVHAVEEFCRSDERLRQIQFIIRDSFVYSVFQKAMTY
ncbi:MAG TPA: macro domain-containing protein [Drouetiella sp.]|jgi:O-acetyl-ADP-ribose deacetylase